MLACYYVVHSLNVLFATSISVQSRCNQWLQFIRSTQVHVLGGLWPLSLANHSFWPFRDSQLLSVLQQMPLAINANEISLTNLILLVHLQLWLNFPTKGADWRVSDPITEGGKHSEHFHNYPIGSLMTFQNKKKDLLLIPSFMLTFTGFLSYMLRVHKITSVLSFCLAGEGLFQLSSAHLSPANERDLLVALISELYHL